VRIKNKVIEDQHKKGINLRIRCCEKGQ